MEKALVASNDGEVSLYLLDKLRRLKLDCSVVTTGKDCLDTVEDNDIGIAVIHNSLLDIRGYKLLDILKDIKPETEIIFINGTHDPKIESRVRQVGVVYYATDPRDEEIMRVVSRLVTKGKVSNLATTGMENR